MPSHDTTTRPPEIEAMLKALYDALRDDQRAAAAGASDPVSGVAVGALDLRRSAIYLAAEANWPKWVRS